MPASMDTEHMSDLLGVVVTGEAKNEVRCNGDTSVIQDDEFVMNMIIITIEYDHHHHRNGLHRKSTLPRCATSKRRNPIITNQRVMATQAWGNISYVSVMIHDKYVIFLKQAEEEARMKKEGLKQDEKKICDAAQDWKELWEGDCITFKGKIAIYRANASKGDFIGIPDVVLKHLDEAQAAKKPKEPKKKGKNNP